jgi:hypothetical protein
MKSETANNFTNMVRVAGKIKPAPMITSKISMHEVIEKGFRALINERDKHVKILIDINA